MYFKTNVTQEIRTKIAAKGIRPQLIDELIDLADELTSSKIAEGVFKIQKPASNTGAINAFNGIYKEVVGICKIARNVLTDNKVAWNSFSFAAAVKIIMDARKKQDDDNNTDDNDNEDNTGNNNDNNTNAPKPQ